jgi:radical SAM superfamily enzyme YgiQ (UPF0313 family)
VNYQSSHKEDCSLDPAIKHLLGLFPHGINRVLLVNPQGVSEKDFNLQMAKRRRYWSYPPAGIAVLAGNLKAAGYDVELLDLNYEVLKAAIDSSNRFNYREAWEDKLIYALDDFEPDVVGISVMFTMQHENMKLIAETCARFGVPVIAGGVHISNAKDLVMDECKELCMLGLYEADLSLPLIFDVINGRRDPDDLVQIAVSNDGGRVIIDKRMPPKLDKIRCPDWCGLKLSEYDLLGQIGTYHFLRSDDRLAASALSNRGCRAKCSFCSVRYFNGAAVRTREVVDVVDEIESMYHQHKIRHITWLDDDLLYDRGRTISMFEEIASRKMDLTWDASNGLIAAAIDEPILDAMVESGCIGFNLGIESGSPEILRAVHKPGTVETFRRCAKLCEKYPELFIKAFLICAMPGETLAQMKQTVDLAVELHYDWCSLQILNPLVGTEMYRSMADQGFLTDNVDTKGRSFTAGVFTSLNLRQREESEMVKAEEFANPFDGDLSRVPEKSELADVWLAMDYAMNYAPIFDMEPGPKLENKRKILVDVCDRITHRNPLGNYFLSIVEEKMGNSASAYMRKDQAMVYLQESDYWQKRFNVLGIGVALDGRRMA